MFFTVNIKPVSSEKMPSLRAFVDITLDNQFVVRGLKIIQKQNSELFVAMPQEKGKVWNEKDKIYVDGWIDKFSPITKEARDILNENVLSQYYKHMDKNNQAVKTSDKENTAQAAGADVEAELGG